jgi:large-conductance mechanosensitive channel
MKDIIVDFVLPILIGFVFGSIITLLNVDTFIIRPIQKEAVEKGYATWEVVNQSTGKTHFRFK